MAVILGNYTFEACILGWIELLEGSRRSRDGSGVVVHISERDLTHPSNLGSMVVVHGHSRTSFRGWPGSSPYVVDVVELDETLSDSSGACHSGTRRIQHLQA